MCCYQHTAVRTSKNGNRLVNLVLRLEYPRDPCENGKPRHHSPVIQVHMCFVKVVRGVPGLQTKEGAVNTDLPHALACKTADLRAVEVVRRRPGAQLQF